MCLISRANEFLTFELHVTATQIDLNSLPWHMLQYGGCKVWYMIKSALHWKQNDWAAVCAYLIRLYRLNNHRCHFTMEKFWKWVDEHSDRKAMYGMLTGIIKTLWPMQHQLSWGLWIAALIFYFSVEFQKVWRRQFAETYQLPTLLFNHLLIVTMFWYSSKRSLMKMTWPTAMHSVWMTMTKVQIVIMMAPAILIIITIDVAPSPHGKQKRK